MLQRFSKYFVQNRALKHNSKPDFSARACMFLNGSHARLLETLCPSSTDSKVMEDFSAQGALL